MMTAEQWRINADKAEVIILNHLADAQALRGWVDHCRKMADEIDGRQKCET